MANQVSKLINHVVSVFDAMPLVNTIILKDDDVLDVEKENIYPLVSIQLLNSIKEQDIVYVSMLFNILNQRDFTTKPITNKLMAQSNYIDNINICDSIGNEFILEILKTHNDLDINIDSYSNFEFIRRDERNCLDGVMFDVNFSLHQNGV